VVSTEPPTDDPSNPVDSSLDRHRTGGAMTTDSIQQLSANTAAYEPFMVGDAAVGEVSWLRVSDDGYVAGLWRSEPTTFPYEFAACESLYVLEGAVTISLEDGSSQELKPGDAASFPAGTKSTWEITKPFVKFFAAG
jgi:uncharacterized cupin superfamily protein